MRSNSSFVLEGEDGFLPAWEGRSTSDGTKNERGEEGRSRSDFDEGDGRGCEGRGGSVREGERLREGLLLLLLGSVVVVVVIGRGKRGSGGLPTSDGNGLLLLLLGRRRRREVVVDVLGRRGLGLRSLRLGLRWRRVRTSTNGDSCDGSDG